MSIGIQVVCNRNIKEMKQRTGEEDKHKKAGREAEDTVLRAQGKLQQMI